jgi:hypothetical protein
MNTRRMSFGQPASFPDVFIFYTNVNEDGRRTIYPNRTLSNFTTLASGGQPLCTRKHIATTTMT